MNSENKNDKDVVDGEGRQKEMFYVKYSLMR